MLNRKTIGITGIVLAAAVTITGCTGGPAEAMATAPAVRTLAIKPGGDRLAQAGQREAEGYYAENAMAYDNADGTQTVYVSSAPLEDGPIAVTRQEDGAFIAEGKYTSVMFPAALAAITPMQFITGVHMAQLLPAGDGSCAGTQIEYANAFGQTMQAVKYIDVFSPGIDYICTPTSFGVNTEIVLAKKPDTNTFQLRLTLPDLIPDTGSPDYILFKTALEDGQVKSILYTPLAVDSKGSWNYTGTVKLTDKDSETGTYTVEYAIDEAFLETASYPVTLNQSAYNYKSKQPDTSAYENTGDEAGHYLSPYMLLGDSTPKGEGWTYIRYETLDRLDIDADRIASAKYVLRNLFDLPREVTVGAYAVTSDWCSINTRWFNRPPNDDKPVGIAKVKAAGDYEVDVTLLLKEMIRSKGNENAKYSVRNSFLIKCDTEGSSLILAAGDNGLFAPCLEITLAPDEAEVTE